MWVICMMKENEVVVKYGMMNLRAERKEARGSLAYIVQDVIDIKSNYIKLGFHLDEFKRCKYYEDFGYSDFYEFVECNFRMDKSATSRVMKMFYKFADSQDGVKKMWIAEAYKDYNYSQLCEMLPLTYDECNKITSDMTIKQIREYKKSLKNGDENNVVATSQQNEQSVDKVFSKSFDSGLLASYLADFLVDVMDNFSNSKEYEVKNDSKNIYIEIDNEKYRVALFHSSVDSKESKNKDKDKKK